MARIPLYIHPSSPFRLTGPNWENGWILNHTFPISWSLFTFPMLGKRLLENFICYGESTEKRKLAPKGGAGNTTYDKVFDAIWDNTIGKL